MEPVNVPLHVPDMVQGLPVPNGQEFRHTPEQDEAVATPPGSIHLREDTSSQDDQVPVRRSTRRQATIERLQPRWGVQTYAQAVQQDTTPAYSVGSHQNLPHTQAGGGIPLP